MNYRVTGANSSTGEDIEVDIEAATERDAREAAHQRGIFVSAIMEVDPPPMSFDEICEQAEAEDARKQAAGRRFKIVGVNRATGADVTTYVSAATPANARAKAELKGIVVPEVQDPEAATPAPGTAIFSDRASPLPSKPKPPFFSVDKIDYVAVMKVKIVLFDPDTNQQSDEVIDVPNDLDPGTLAGFIEHETGSRVLRIIVLDRRWVETHYLGALEKGLIGYAVYSLFTR
jgi:hypothetical protein